MRIVRSTVLRLLSSRQAELVLGSSPRALSELNLRELRRRADEASSLHGRYAEVAARQEAALRTGGDRAARQVALDTARKADLFAEAAARYERTADRREEQLRRTRTPPRRTPRGVTVLSITGERVAPGVTAGRDIQVRKKPGGRRRRSRSP